MAVTPTPKSFIVRLKTGTTITVLADRAESEWPALRLMKDDDTMVAAWFGDAVESVIPSSAVVVDPVAPGGA